MTYSYEKKGKNPGKYVIGITGGVGSGKSTVLNILEETFGAHIFQADQIARELMEPGGASYCAVVEAFGQEILQESFQENLCEQGNSAEETGIKFRPIDRARLASIVFADEAKLELLNSLTHPLVFEEMKSRIRENIGLIILEAALPKEARFSEICDAIWYIHVPEEIRVERLMASRGYSEEKCREIMANQLSEKEFISLATVVIENGGSTDETESQIREKLSEIRGTKG